jgi:hypothetical protein
MRHSDQLARALGWFSIGLGLAELLAAHRITGALGMEGNEGVVRAYGMREIGSGVLSLSLNRQLGLWSRVAGDGLDIATLMTALRPENAKRENVGIALAVVAGVTLLDIAGAQAVTSQHKRRGKPRNYRNRSGFPGGAQAARGLARKDFETPKDMRASPALSEQPDQAEAA